MIPTNRIPTHPGIILLETLATYLNISIKQINKIVQEQDKITPEIAWLLAQAFNTTPQFWMNLQTNYDLALNKPKEIKQAITM
jgi:antitoxin HigA-1